MTQYISSFSFLRQQFTAKQRLISVLALLLLTGAFPANAQSNLGIGTATPDASALVEMQSSSKGLLVPRLTQAQRVAIATPATGLLVYQTDGAQPGFWYNAGTAAAPTWTFFNPSADNLGNHTATQNLSLQNNALTGTSQYIGTGVGVGITPQGGLNLGQNVVGHNVYIGFRAGEANLAAGTENHFVGFGSGMSNTTGTQNHFSGYQSGISNTTGSYNHYSGMSSGGQSQTGSFNLFIGYNSGYQTMTSENHFVGFSSGSYNSTGYRNHFSGNNSGNSNTIGYDNHFEGYRSGNANVSGSNNLFVGNRSGYGNTTGNTNLFVGNGSGNFNITGYNNWAFGQNAGPSVDGLHNAGAIGNDATVSQSNSLVLGSSSTKVGIGTTAPRGTLDVASGDTYLVANPANGNSQSVYLPGHLYLAPYSSSTPWVYLQARVPNPTATTNLGMVLRTTKNGGGVDALVMNPDGNGYFAKDIYANGNVFVSSDQRLKQDIRPLGGTLSAVRQLRGVRYTYRQDIAGHAAPKGQQVGLLAQEVERIYPELVSTGADGYKAVNYAQLTPVLLEALKEQQQQVDVLNKYAEVFTRRAAEAEAASVQRDARAEAAITSLEQRLRQLESESTRAQASR